MIRAEVIADSISPAGKRLTTMQLRYPRFVHAEFMTHRVFSRNASSSRAIPVRKLIEDLRREPAMPVFWGSNRPGMQAGDELIGDDLGQVKACWSFAMEECIHQAEMMVDRGLHKQIANRVLEPWAHINVTATEWDNFYALRCHPDAQPEMRALAEAMRDVMQASTPELLEIGRWHLPYVPLSELEEMFDGWHMRQPKDKYDLVTKVGIKMSVARCARVSYLTHEGKPPNQDEDQKLYERLVGSVPLHASPAEHQATPDDYGKFGSEIPHWRRPDLHGNFVGWSQFRKQLEQEHVI
jgi:hypothetical protein